MAQEIKDGNVTQKEADTMQSPMELDLWSLFVGLEEDMINLSKKAIREGMTPEEYIAEAEELLIG